MDTCLAIGVGLAIRNYCIIKIDQKFVVNFKCTLGKVRFKIFNVVRVFVSVNLLFKFKSQKLCSIHRIILFRKDSLKQRILGLLVVYLELVNN